MVNQPNTIYEVRYDFDLNGETITIPDNCTLKFEGGKISNGCVIFNETYIDGGKECFRDVLPKEGTITNEEVIFDWFSPTKITLEQYKNREIVSTNNAKLLTSIFNCFHQVTAIRFGKGIYVFEDDITIYSRHGMEIQGYSYNETCLYFPNSKGLYFFAGNFNSGTISDMFIHSKQECIRLRYEDADNRMNAVNDCTFGRLKMLSECGDFCFGSDIDYVSFMYHNSFKDVGVSGKSGFCCVANLGTIFDGIYDLYQDFAHKQLSPRKDMSLFYNCNNVHIINSNVTYNSMGHIYKYDADSTHTAFSASFVAENCNFEGITDEFITTNDSILLQLSVCFTNCTFYSSQTGEEPIHFRIYRPGILKGFPSGISGPGGGTTRYKFGIQPSIMDVASSSPIPYKGDVQYYIIPTYLQSPETIGAAFAAGSDKLYSLMQNMVQAIAPKYAIRRYCSAVPIDIDLTEEKSYGGMLQSMLASILRIKKADKENSALKIEDHKVQTLAYGQAIACGYIEILNKTNYVITVTHTEKDLQVGSYIILPHHGYTHHYNSHTPPLSPYNYGGSTMMYLTNGYRFFFKNAEYVCLEKGCGIYCTATLKDNTKYTYTDRHMSGYGLYEKDGYIYYCIKAGTTGELGDDLTKTVNEFVDSGTAQFVCIGKCAVIARVSGDTASRPSLESIYKGFEYFDTDQNKSIWWDGSKWIDNNGNFADAKVSGATEERPTGIKVGYIYKDTTLGKLILWDGSAWVNMDGTALA